MRQQNFYQDKYTKFPDEEVPALNGLTPRQAAADPESRPLLLELMKEQLIELVQPEAFASIHVKAVSSSEND